MLSPLCSLTTISSVSFDSSLASFCFSLSFWDRFLTLFINSNLSGLIRNLFSTVEGGRSETDLQLKSYSDDLTDFSFESISSNSFESESLMSTMIWVTHVILWGSERCSFLVESQYPSECSAGSLNLTNRLPWNEGVDVFTGIDLFSV